MVLLHSEVMVETSFNLLKFIQDLGPTIISAIALFVTYKLTKKTLGAQDDQTKKTLDAQKDIEARILIRRKLDEFYGPFLQIRRKSTLLYKIFSARHRVTDPNFSTLTFLLSGKKFGGNDNILLKQIIRLGEESENLIHEKAGLIDSIELRQNLIPRASTHYLVLRLANEGMLKEDLENFKDLTFPIELDEKLEERKKQLEVELENLNRRII